MDAPDQPLADELLVVAAILGDLPAFDELVMRYRAAVVRTAQGIVGRAEAEDVAQDALLLAFKALPSIEDPARFPAWLMAITRHRAYRVRQQEQTRRAHRVDLDDLLLERLPALAPREPLEGHEFLQRALDRIPAPYALVLRLHFLDEMPHKRIAAALDVPVSTVKWRVHHGKQLLRKAFEHLNREARSWTETKNSPS